MSLSESYQHPIREHDVHPSGGDEIRLQRRDEATGFQFFVDDMLHTGSIGEWAAPLGSGQASQNAQRLVARAGWRNENSAPRKRERHRSPFKRRAAERVRPTYRPLYL